MRRKFMSRIVVRGSLVCLLALAALIAARLSLFSTGDMLVTTDTNGYMYSARKPFLTSLAMPKGDPYLCRNPALPTLLRMLRITTIPLTDSQNERLRIFNMAFLGGILLLLAWQGWTIWHSSLWLFAWMVFWLCLSMSEFVFSYEMSIITEFYGIGIMFVTIGSLAAALWSHGAAVRAIHYVVFTAALVFLIYLKESMFFLGACHVAASVGLLWIVRESGRKPKASCPEGDLSVRPAKRSVRLAALVSVALCCLCTVGASLHSVSAIHARHKFRFINTINYLGARVLPDDRVREAYRSQLSLPEPLASLRGGNCWTMGDVVVDTRVVQWVEDYSKNRHLTFLASNPALALRVFVKGSQKIAILVGSKAWGSGWANRQRCDEARGEDNSRRALVSRVCSVIVLWPFTLLRFLHATLPVLAAIPLLVILLACGRRAASTRRFFVVQAFLVLVVYGVYAVTIFMEGSADYRHSLIGSLCLVLFYWSALLQTAGFGLRGMHGGLGSFFPRWRIFFGEVGGILILSVCLRMGKTIK